MADSVLTRVRVERLVNIMAIFLPRSDAWRCFGSGWPDLMADLWADALRMSFVSSAGVRSAVERKWRGANGEVGFVEGVL